VVLSGRFSFSFFTFKYLLWEEIFMHFSELIVRLLYWQDMNFDILLILTFRCSSSLLPYS
jgi:hypothetical protein